MGWPSGPSAAQAPPSAGGGMAAAPPGAPAFAWSGSPEVMLQYAPSGVLRSNILTSKLFLNTPSLMRPPRLRDRHLSAPGAGSSRCAPAPDDNKRCQHDDHGHDAEHGELRGTEHRPGSRAAVPAGVQARLALEVVARAGEEELVDGVRDGK